MLGLAMPHLEPLLYSYIIIYHNIISYYIILYYIILYYIIDIIGRAGDPDVGVGDAAQ